MRIKFVVDNGKVDSNGDKINLAGIQNISSPIPLLKEFKPTGSLGACQLKLEGGLLVCIADIPKEDHELFPSLGYQAIKGKISFNEKESTTYIKACTAFAVGLTKSRNTSHDIRPIKVQLLTGEAKII